jgi:hypothetical protein
MTSRSVPAGERSVIALAAVCTALACVPVRAQTADLVELIWNAPEGCSDAADVQARIRKLAAAARPARAPLRAEATIARKASGDLQLKLVIRAGDLVGERVIEGRSCEALAGAAAVNLALLLGSAEPLGAADVGAQPAPVQQKQQAAAPAKPTEKDEVSTRTWRGLLDLPLGALELGPTVQPSVGGAIGAGVSIDHWRIVAEGTLWLRQKLTVTTPLAAGANVDRSAAALRACLGFPFGRFELAPCVHVSLQHVSARGTGAHIAARTNDATWVAPGVGVQSRYRLTSWLALLAGVDAAIEGARPRIEIDGVGRVGQLGPAALKIVLGTEWIL